ncbi:MAG: hypothetical protein ACLR5J_13630 [Lachnospiraceae bacterium]
MKLGIGFTACNVSDTTSISLYSVAMSFAFYVDLYIYCIFMAKGE